MSAPIRRQADHPSATAPLPIPDSSRRHFVQGLAAGGILLSLPALGLAHGAMDHTMDPASASPSSTGTAPELRGREFHLTIAETLVNFTGQPRLATTVNGCFPGPTLRWKEGDTVTLHVTNRLREDTSIHWHGIKLPYEMDGVPGISFAGIPPGATFTYRFTLRQSGTYWYHGHSGMQELMGLYGAIVIEPAAGERFPADREHIVHLGDWSDEDPMRVYAKLKAQSDYYNYHRPTASDFLRDVMDQGWRQAVAKRRMWHQMRMNPTDLADLSAATLSYLINGRTPHGEKGNWTGLFKPGEKVRLRFINGAAHTFYDVRIPGLKLTVVQADGGDIEPVTVDEFRIGPGETYDALVSPVDDAYTLFAQTMDRSGYARATLAVKEGLSAPVPALDPVQWLSMDDMMGAMMGGRGTERAVNHARSEYGPSTDMRVDVPRINLDDPGIGLRGNGRRVLTLADQHSLAAPDDPREPEREIELHLTGNMERYAWSMDGLAFGDSTPVHFKHGERLRVVLHNDTMMTHPMHMHGFWSELESPEGRLQVRRHTLPLQPAQQITFRVSADTVGRWAWHCHLMLHMDAGMFREVVVA